MIHVQSWKRASVALQMLALILLCASAAVACAAAPPLAADAQTTSARVIKGPYLIYPGKNTEMTVLWQMDGKGQATLTWGPNAQLAAGSIDSVEYGADHQYRQTLTGLRPGALYHYRLVAGGETFEGTFHAAPPDDAKKIAFFAYGDTRTHPETHDAIAGAIVSRFTKDPALQTLVVFSGDYVYDGDQEAMWTREFFNRSMTKIRQLLMDVPLMGCMGNHEGHGVLFTKYFPYPFVAARYYSFDYGPAHFAVLDQYTDDRAGSAQLAWLEKDLAASAKPWKFIALHEPGWTAGSHPNNKTVQQVIQPVCKKYGVAAVLGGHNHYYARAVVDGVIHLTSGGGGAPLYDPDPKQPHLVVTKKTFEYCLMTIDGDRFHCVVYTPDGEVVDDFTIDHPPQPAAAADATPTKKPVGLPPADAR